VAALDSLLHAFELEPTAPGAFRAENAESGHGVVFGGQLLGQSIVAGLAGQAGKTVKTLHTIFARAASPDAALAITVERLHEGRSFASRAVTIAQSERLCARSLLLLSADEPDFIRHAEPPPVVPGPDACKPAGEGLGGWEIRVVGGVDVSDPGLVGPPELDVWTRFLGAPDEPALAQALLAFATDGFLIGTAMRPHPGVGQAQAHRTVSTGVVSHTLTFHEPHSAKEWLLLSHRSPYAGHGRCYGRANVFRADGTLVASFVQDGMIRPLDSRAGAGRL
jgi:acyl-CoA thioesterase